MLHPLQIMNLNTIRAPGTYPRGSKIPMFRSYKLSANSLTPSIQPSSTAKERAHLEEFSLVTPPQSPYSSCDLSGANSSMLPKVLSTGSELKEINRCFGSTPPDG